MVYKLYDLVKVGRKPHLNGHGPLVVKAVAHQSVAKFRSKFDLIKQRGEAHTLFPRSKIIF